MIINANALSIPLADQSVHMIVTSPPYWGLRNYGVSGQLGLERTPEEYIANMVAVFRECWRVLRDDGTCWVNIGDSYASGSGGYEDKYNGAFVGREDIKLKVIKNKRPKIDNLKPKDLVGIPWRLAFALQADGWYLRSDIIWSKPNPMPESVTDRPTKSHEYLFLLAKQERYYYDAEAIKEEIAESTINDNRLYKDYDPPRPERGFIGSPSQGATLLKPNSSGRNRRSVWTIPTAPYKGAHFATFPPALVEPCIKAGTSERGCCPKCGKGWKRDLSKESHYEKRQNRAQPTRIMAQVDSSGWSQPTIIDNGWQPSCTCNAGDPIPCLVFDPFVGSGTTVKVAYDLGRHGVGLDLSLDYLDEQARKRIHNGHTARLF